MMAHHATCGRPTKSGAPCRATVSVDRPVCHAHLTDIDRQWMAVVEQFRAECWVLQQEAARERQAPPPVKESAAPCRTNDQQGAQIVSVVFGRGTTEYAYRWTGAGLLKVGDEVLTPAAYWDTDGAMPRVGRVVRLGTKGYCHFFTPEELSQR